jgi:hypothetical protein
MAKEIVTCRGHWKTVAEHSSGITFGTRVVNVLCLAFGTHDDGTAFGTFIENAHRIGVGTRTRACCVTFVGHYTHSRRSDVDQHHRRHYEA